MQPPKDNSKINIRLFIQLVMLVTAIFAIFILVVYTLAYSPPQPNIANPYNMQEWPTAEAQMIEQINTYQAIQVNPETGMQLDPAEIEEGDPVVTRYTVPISVAKQVLIQQGLPAREAGGTQQSDQ
jgi:hypothetical protein